MRDTRKSKEYFDEYLKYQRSRIEKKTAKLPESDEGKKQRILMSLTGYEVDLLKAEYSCGASKERMKELLLSAIGIAKEYKNMTYEDLLNLLSISVLVGERANASALIEANKEKVFNDRLLNFFALYIQEKEPLWKKELSLLDEFAGLDKVFWSDEKAVELLSYLNSWYDNHSCYGWYNSHLSDSDTYCGYWSFESAAIAIILGIREGTLKASIYYPSFD